MIDIFKYNMELYNQLIKNIADCNKYYITLLEKLIGMHNIPNRNTQGNSDIFPANGHDIYNYVARYNMSNLQNQAVMKLDGRLDFEKLKRAVRLSIDVEPIFGCRFVEGNPPYWKRLENIAMINFCTLDETDNIEQALQSYSQSYIDLDNDPMLNVKIIRSEQNDALVLKINHACCDGAGLKEYIQLLANIYNGIDHEDSRFIPDPRISGRKDQDRLLSELGITNPDLLFKPGSDISLPMWPFPWEQSGSNTPCTSVCQLRDGYLDEIIKSARNKGSTVNDFLLTAYYRAMLQMKQPIYGLPMEIPITVDLRRYLPENKTQAIRNFSGSVSTRLIMSIDEPFNETLRRVTYMTKEVKKGYPGLQSALGLERLENISFQETLAYYHATFDIVKANFCPLYYGDTCLPTLSNLGYLSKSLIGFGNTTVTDAYILPPVIRAPGILLVTGTYNSVLTLSTGYYKSTVSKEAIELLLNKIKDEITQGCYS